MYPDVGRRLIVELNEPLENLEDPLRTSSFILGEVREGGSGYKYIQGIQPNGKDKGDKFTLDQVSNWVYKDEMFNAQIYSEEEFLKLHDRIAELEQKAKWFDEIDYRKALSQGTENLLLKDINVTTSHGSAPEINLTVYKV